jgi:hypothetical protein
LWPFGYILRPFGIFLAVLIHFITFGLLYQEKSGNPAATHQNRTFFLGTEDRHKVHQQKGMTSFQSRQRKKVRPIRLPFIKSGRLSKT